MYGIVSGWLVGLPTEVASMTKLIGSVKSARRYCTFWHIKAVQLTVGENFQLRSEFFVLFLQLMVSLYELSFLGASKYALQFDSYFLFLLILSHQSIELL